ncbi:MAG: PIG-L family deacetylase [Chitinophagaceae bacterium]
MKVMITLNSFYLKVMMYLLITCCLTLSTIDLFAQTNQQPLYKVLTLTGEKQGSRDIPQDHGLDGIWQKLLKLKTIASAMHTQAHPDDEHADLLTYLSRGKGVRTAILSLNRGESGANILGIESFDQLALLRTEEFLLAATYYGLDDLYFTNLVDYGFSKRVEEAYEKWGRQNVLREMVRVIRINRPLVIISRFHGTSRDGHGNHQAAGEISLEAYNLAGDPNAFPELIKEGLHP